MRIVVVSAGLSNPSSTRLLADMLADATVRAVAARGGEASVQHVELRSLAHALTDHLLTGFPPAALKTAMTPSVTRTPSSPSRRCSRRRTRACSRPSSTCSRKACSTVRPC